MRKVLLACLSAALLAACSRDPAPAVADAPAPQPPIAAPDVPPPDHVSPDPMPTPPDPMPTPPDLDPAPWSAAPLAADAVPAQYLAQWRKAGNRATCAPVAPADTADRPDARPRPANFSGGWAVAYDEPGLRSAFGIAGAGIEATGAGDSPWPDSVTWADGSIASYGLEGGTGPGHLAYLEIAGQGCLYNVWSKLGEAHLLALLHKLRRVETAGAK
jgi:hypothetical protein